MVFTASAGVCAPFAALAAAPVADGSSVVVVVVVLVVVVVVVEGEPRFRFLLSRSADGGGLMLYFVVMRVVVG